MGRFIDLTGQRFNDWTVIEYMGKSKWRCQCKCGTIAVISGGDLKNGNSKHCKNCRVIDLTGQQINDWTVLKRLDNNKWLCRCSCGVQKEVFGHSLRNKTTKDCGHSKQAINFINIKGQKFGEWEALEYLGNSMWKCRCSCGKISNIHSQSLRSGNSKSCGHNNIDTGNLSGKQIGDWTVLCYIGNGQYKCRCSCGKIQAVFRSNLQSDGSHSCGHNRADRVVQYNLNNFYKDKNAEQLKILSSDEEFKAYIISINENDTKPTIPDIARKLNCNYGYILARIHRQELIDYVNFGFLSRSSLEKEIYQYITSIYSGKIALSTRSVIPPLELDIYIPDKNIAIEVNGDFWHSDRFKDRDYHKSKAINCLSHGVRLISIFEYEWTNSKDKIKQILYSSLHETNRIYARNTVVTKISNEQAKQFCNEYHLQGGINSSLNYGILKNNELLSVITLGKPRFDNNHEYEVLRYCTKSGITVIGGFSKLFKHFLYEMKPNSVITYIDLSKFHGDSYYKAGFKPCKEPISIPGYVWVDRNGNVLTRYQTQKHKLVENNLGNESQTEDEIMRENKFYKVYNCGNIKLEWLNSGK